MASSITRDRPGHWECPTCGWCGQFEELVLKESGRGQWMGIPCFYQANYCPKCETRLNSEDDWKSDEGKETS